MIEDYYNAQVYSLASGWFQPDIDYIHCAEYSASSSVIVLFAKLQELIYGLFADPNYKEDF